MFKKVWASYANALVKRPLITKMATTTVIYGAGDATSQALTPYLNKTEYKYDIRRNLGQAAFGFFCLGPFYHQYFRVLDILVKSTGAKGATLKLLIDQTIGATIIISGFTIWGTMFKGGSFNDAITQLKTSFVSIFKLNAMVWPAASIINFGLVPLEYRTLFVNCVAFFWSIILSYVFAEEVKKESK